MGTDIHIVIEVRAEDPDEWIGIYSCGNPLNPPYGALKDCPLRMLGYRDYAFFGLLAGVRRRGSSSAKGLPDDISSMARMFFAQWEMDAHSPSYKPLKEFLRLKISASEELTSQAAEISLRGGDPISQLLGPYSEDIIRNGIDNFRVVFWFDN